VTRFFFFFFLFFSSKKVLGVSESLPISEVEEGETGIEEENDDSDRADVAEVKSNLHSRLKCMCSCVLRTGCCVIENRTFLDVEEELECASDICFCHR
jgi:hypothetical protein